jgi:hypothetical protein
LKCLIKIAAYVYRKILKKTENFRIIELAEIILVKIYILEPFTDNLVVVIDYSMMVRLITECNLNIIVIIRI